VSTLQLYNKSKGKLFSYIIKKELFGRFFCIKLNSSSIFFISSARCECASYHTHTLVLYVHTPTILILSYISILTKSGGVGIKKRYEVKKFFVFFVFVCILRVCVCVCISSTPICRCKKRRGDTLKNKKTEKKERKTVGSIFLDKNIFYFYSYVLYTLF